MAWYLHIRYTSPILPILWLISGWVTKHNTMQMLCKYLLHCIVWGNNDKIKKESENLLYTICSWWNPQLWSLQIQRKDCIQFCLNTCFHWLWENPTLAITIVSMDLIPMITTKFGGIWWGSQNICSHRQHLRNGITPTAAFSSSLSISGGTNFWRPK